MLTPTLSCINVGGEGEVGGGGGVEYNAPGKEGDGGAIVKIS